MPAKTTIFQKISDEAVEAKTGEVWRHWFGVLDKFGMKEKGHTQAAKHLRERHGLSPWWAQAVVIRYEWENGLRRPAKATGKAPARGSAKAPTSKPRQGRHGGEARAIIMDSHLDL